jgi:hypothetical protein
MIFKKKKVEAPDAKEEAPPAKPRITVRYDQQWVVDIEDGVTADDIFATWPGGYLPLNAVLTGGYRPGAGMYDFNGIGRTTLVFAPPPEKK